MFMEIRKQIRKQWDKYVNIQKSIEEIVEGTELESSHHNSSCRVWKCIFQYMSIVEDL